MNIPVIFKKVANIAKGIGGNVWLIGKKHAPEAAIGSGIVLFGITIFETVKATNNTNDILQEKERKEMICAKNLNDKDTDYTITDYEHDMSIVKRETRWEIIKAWMLVGTTGIAGITMVLYGYKLINGRYVATAAAYKALESGYERYRQNVINEFGDEVDWRMRNSLKAEEVEKARQEREQNALIAKENKKLRKRRPTTKYQYESASAVFDQYSERWRQYWNPSMVLDYLYTKQDQANDKLNINKHVFLNEIFDMLGLPRTKEGQVLGWIRTNNNKTKIDFGINDMPENIKRDFLSTQFNEDIWIRLHFNVDGMILDMLDQSYDILKGNEH